MIQPKKILRWSLAVVTVAFLTIAYAAEKPGGDKDKKEKQSLEKGAGTPRWQILNINNLTTWGRSDGESNHSPSGDNGVYYPVGTGNVVYEDGIVFGSKLFLDAAKTTQPSIKPIRVGGGTYQGFYGAKAGYITGQGASARAADPNAADVRYYRIRRDYASMSEGELRSDAQTSYELAKIDQVTTTQVEAIKAQYEKDWKEWPVDKGAPYIDRNNNGKYDAPPAFGDNFTVDSLISGNYDEPGVAGADPSTPADQVMWTVYNDLDRALSLRFEGSEPTGLEIQVTTFAYKRTDALGNVYFKRLRITNKGGVDVGGGTLGAFYLDSMFVCQWSDIDLGDAFDDLAGCDTVRSMGFIYNALPVDGTFIRYGLPPPSSGYDFLAGPVIPGAPTDSAVVDFKRVYGKKNLPMTGFSYFSAGSPYSDPPGNNYETGTGRWWNMLRGYAPLGTITEPPRPYAHPPGYEITKFPLSGDPVTGQGFIDGQGTDYSFVTGDRRILVITGPFELNPGESQDIYIGFVVGLGADRLSSVSVMKANDNAVQETFDLLFRVAKPPASPLVKVSEMDGEVFLEWSSNLAQVAATETRIIEPGHYTFEGYNVYQFPAAGARIAEAKLLGTYDVVNTVKVILNEQFDLKAGAILKVPIQFGGDNGVKRYFKFDKDYIRDIEKIYNGQAYYLGVTAYSYTSLPGYLAALESSPNILTVRPKVPFGKVFTAKFGDTLKVTKTGESDGSVVPIVLDPGTNTGDSYEVRFEETAGTMTWKLLNKTKNRTLLSGQTNQSGNDDYPIVEGVFVKVQGPPPGVKSWGWTGSRFLTWAGGADGFGFEGFSGAFGWASPRAVFGDGKMLVGADQLKKIEVRFAVTTDNKGTFNATDANASYAYRYGRGFAGSPAKPEFAPWIINKVGGYSYQDYRVSAPVAVYDVDATPPRRLAIGFLENNVTGGSVDGIYWPPFYNVGDNTSSGGPREWLFIFDTPYTDATPDPKLQKEIIGGVDMRVMYWATWARRNDNPWPAGNIMTITPNRINTVNTVFAYTSAGPLTGAEQEKLSAEKVGVFPNPYYASNIGESSRFDRFVSFNNLPKEAKIRIYNIAGHLVRVLDKNDESQFVRWDLMNLRNYPIASGMYIAYVDMPTVGSTKILKFAVIQEQEILDRY